MFFISVPNMDRCAVDESLVALRMRSREHSAALSLMQAADHQAKVTNTY